ncbi:DNA double-strand break repair nuclease NurA [Thermohalobacter berrensis]|uniref:NurA domain protein n=1 Tax=Thermohalobacter berrensis TaxID=99594 RepID=A0A419SUJ7_9FIRM|nr:DNA double-strand break repair nuclease NurA [Thermohalobacter berrensis]RKD28842.1 NurA domain protein [Thermohalobacter berrensis]
MLNTSNELKDKLIKLNRILNENYKLISKIDNINIKDFVSKNIGEIKSLCRIKSNELECFSKEGGILGVDGSKNRMGGAYPHFVEVFQGLAKSSIYQDNPIYKADFYTPLNLKTEKEIIEKIDKENPAKNEIDSFIRNYKLSSIEVEVAIEGANKLNPYVIMMDGSLIRYKIECTDKWNELKSLCEEKGIILIGVIKDIKTNIIGTSLIEKDILPPNIDNLYDKELLYGLLEYGEMITINKENTKKYNEGLRSCFMRTSKDPSVVGMDILKSQEKYMKEMADLVFTLTPYTSRGVPLWLDIVDSEVKISDKMMKGLLEKYLDREILEKFFISERSKRTM